MRKPRAIVIADDKMILDVFQNYLGERGYDVLKFTEPDRCPVYRNISTCETHRPCGDVMLVDYLMPVMNGVDLLKAQLHMGCRMSIRNKALISGYHDERALEAVRRLGCAAFAKPPVFDDIAAWLAQCEQQMDLSQELGMPRKERRVASGSEAVCQIKINDEVISATALNHSRSGLCLKVNRPLFRDQIVTLLTSLPLESYKAVVRWTSETVNHGFLAGVSCC